jgi:predicted nucleotidyltransferase
MNTIAAGPPLLQSPKPSRRGRRSYKIRDALPLWEARLGPIDPQAMTDTVKPEIDKCSLPGLQQILLAQPQLEFAVLVGSRASGTARANSDWDIALQWSPQLDWLTVLGLTETLRRTLAETLQTDSSAIDLIELRQANLAMRASVAEEGLPLTGQDTLATAHFLRRTWPDQEDFYLRITHAA